MEEAGVELKATPFKKLKEWEIQCKRRLVLNIINYEKVAEEQFEESSFCIKTELQNWHFMNMLKIQREKNGKLKKPSYMK